MPKIDFPNQKVPNGYKPPEPPVKLVEGMNFEEVKEWIFQELYKIYHCEDNYIIKEMKKEDVYDKLIEANYDVEELFKK